MTRKHLFAVILCFTMAVTALGQTNNLYQRYIDTYKIVAILQMQKYGIPASITLAQGLLESAAGQSRLATQANNHFGIKVSNDWTGPYILSDDDRKDEKFRKYNNVSESFEDHSLFLRRSRYAPLFQLSPTDYKGWAQTLKSCGYATSPTYAENLISIIERYNLTQYDNALVTADQASQYVGTTNTNRPYSNVGQMKTNEKDFFTTHHMGRCNGNYYIVVQKGDDIESIAEAVGQKAKKLRKYNDIPAGCGVWKGQIIYLGPKKNQAASEMQGKAHIVKASQSIYDISQLYGVKMSRIYEINNLSADHKIRVGEALFVR